MSQQATSTAFKPIAPDVELIEGTQCVQCGGNDITLVRKDPKGNHRLKCLTCTFTFTQDNAMEAAKLNGLASSSDKALASAQDPETITVESPVDIRKPIANPGALVTNPGSYVGVPRTPRYVFVSKDRKTYEFVGTREFKKAILRWEQGGKYDLFELELKKADVSVKIG